MKKWVVRGLVLTITGLLVLGVLFFRYWTDPALVRQKVIERIQSDLKDVRVNLSSARLRLFGGITLSELRLSRRFNMENRDFFYLPSAILYHDKEQLLDGVLALRKIELDRPSLHLIRDREGRWNLRDIMQPKEPTEQTRFPSVIVREGTLTLEDHFTKYPVSPLEVNHIHLTMINDPINVVTFEGRGHCNFIGPIAIQGRYRRDTGAFKLSLTASGIPIGLQLSQQIQGYFPSLVSHIKDLRGTAKVSVTLEHQPGSVTPFRYDLTTELINASWSHPQLPWKMEEMNLTVRCVDGQIPKATLTARTGKTEFEIKINELDLQEAMRGAWWYAAKRAEMSARHLYVDQAIYDQIPSAMTKSIAKYWADYSPRGDLSYRYVCERLSRTRWRRHLLLIPEKLTSVWSYFKYPIKNITGTLEAVQTGPPPATVKIQGYSVGDPDSPFRNAEPMESFISLDIQGTASGAPVTVKGTGRGPFATSAIDVTITARDLPINQTLMSSLSEQHRQTIEPFEPTGLFDVDIDVTRKFGTQEIIPVIRTRFHHGTVRYRRFPLPLKRASGQFDIYPDHWEFRDFVADYKTGRILASGRSHPSPRKEKEQQTTLIAPKVPEPPSGLAWENKPEPPEKKQRVSIRIEGQNLPLDDDFEEALAPGRDELAKVWRIFAITGQMSFVAVIDDLPDRPQDMDVTLSIAGCRMKPAFFPLPLTEVSGTARYASDSVQLFNFRGKHRDAEFIVDRGTVLLKKEGGFWAELNRLRTRSLTFDVDFLKALPRVLRDACVCLNLQDPIQSSSRLVIDQKPTATAPTVYWSSLINLENAKLTAGVELSRVTGKVGCVGLYDEGRIQDIVGRISLSQAFVFDQPLKDTTARFAVWKKTPDVLRVWDLQSSLFGGTLGGQVRIELGSIFRYEVILKALGVKLEQFGKHNIKDSSDLSGEIIAGLYLQGKGEGLNGLRGNGTIDVPEGKMYRLPLLLDLMKWLGLRLPDRTAFEQAHARFNIEGPRVNVEKLDLFGNAISVRGKGSLRLDGSDLDLDLNADWGRISEFLPSTVNRITRGISDQLLKIKVKGSISNAKFEKQIVPFVTNPLKKLFGGGSP